MLGRKKSKSHGLKIIIIGCGKVGNTLIEQLSQEGHDLTVIDQNPIKISEITNAYDVMGLVGNGASYSVQKEAGVQSADLLIAVTGSDELNLLCCTIATQESECSTIARVRTPDYSQETAYLQNKLGLTMIINPELEAARETARILFLPSALEVTSFAHGQAELIKFKIPAGNMLCGMDIATFGKHIPINVLFCAVERGKNVFIPSGEFVFQEGDIISFVSTRKNARSFFKHIGVKSRNIRSAMIVGGGTAGFYLAQQLCNAGLDVKLIESKAARCETLSILLPEATIIHGNAIDQGLLEEEGITETESFIPLTGIDEENIMLTLYAKHVSDAKVITRVTRIGFKDVIDSLNLGSVIYPKYITSEAIIAYVRAKHASKDNSDIETLSYMFNGKAEAIEFLVKEESAVTNIPLCELPLKKNLLLTFISRNGKVIFPHGDDCIKVGDTVMVVTTHAGFHNILDILA